MALATVPHGTALVIQEVARRFISQVKLFNRYFSPVKFPGQEPTQQKFPHGRDTLLTNRRNSRYRTRCIFRPYLLFGLGDILLRPQGFLSRPAATGRDGRSANVLLGIPGKISRKYQGTLAVRAIDGKVAPIVSMDLETAMASVVAPESGQATPLEALKAQAIVTRSYLLAGKGRHRDFDFCDDTHCQFLREPPGPGTLAAIATLSTRGLVILFNEKPVAAMFTRSCSGNTQTSAELGIPPGSYPYYPVLCCACYKSPVRWTRRISGQDADQLLGKGETGRLRVDRRLGWNTVPSNTFDVKREDHEVILEGRGRGHGIGLCQRGSKAMAKGGAKCRDIINHYFPNTTLSNSEESKSP